MTPMDLAYRKTAVQGASGLGLLIALYDTLAGDLRRAAEAQRRVDLEDRSRELKHALLVVAALENWIEADSGELAKQLVAFYARLRRNILEAQAKQSAEMLEHEMTEIIRIREMWQGLDLRNTSAGPEILPPEREQRYSVPLRMQMEHTQLSWSA